MTSPQWPDRFENMLRPYLPLLEPAKPIEPDLSLADHGLDSLATVSLLLELEDEFGVTIPDELLTATTFGTPQGLWNVMASLAEGSPAS